METVFTYILKVNALIVLFYLVYQLALSRETFYKHSRWFLLSGLLLSVLLPFITFTRIEYYEVNHVLNSIENNVPQMVQISNEAVNKPILNNQEILFLVYGIICLGFFIKTLFDFFKLFKIITISNSEKRDKLVYINTNLVHTPFSFFNYIVFNEELINPVELQNIIKHEEAHSIQKHSFDTLLAQFFIILFWFNPIVWFYRKCIVQNLEFLADSFAIQQVSDKEYYQKTMLKITTQSSNITIINTFNQSSIKKRIIMLNTNQSHRKNIWKYILVLPLLTAFMLLFQIETKAQEKPSKNNKQEIKIDTLVWKENKDKAIIKNGDWKKVDSILRSKTNVSQELKNKSNLETQSKDPLFIVNGKEMRRSDILHKSIITEGETTIYNEKEGFEKFGEKGKDGVYILNGKTTFTDEPKLLKVVPENPEKKYFELANGDGCVLFNGYMLKIPSFPSFNLKDSKNKVYIDGKLISYEEFLNYNHKNLESVDVLKFSGESFIDGKSNGKYDNGFGVMFKTK